MKRHPVPFGEYIPFRAELTGLISRLDQIPRDFYAGHRPGNLTVGPARVGDVICFEVAYDGLVRDVVRGGAQVLVVQTNNATYNGTGQPYQQMAMSRLRAVETGRDVLVPRPAASARSSRRGRHGGPAGSGEGRPHAGGRGAAARPADAGHPAGLLAGVAAGRCGAGRGGGVVGRLRGPAAAGERSVTGEMPPADVVGLPAEVVPGAGVLVIVPTYQERLNVENIVGRVRASVPLAHVLVVDDASPDGTGALADALAATDAQVHVLHRAAKEGLGVAYLAGFGWGLERDYDVLVEMDADGSHQPEQLPRLLAALRRRRPGAGLAVGAGRLGGQLAGPAAGCCRGAATSTCGMALGLGVHDATGGYRAFRREHAGEAGPGRRRQSQGYCFQVDLAWRTVQQGLRVAEVPIEFVERERGDSQDERRDRARGARGGSPVWAARRASDADCGPGRRPGRTDADGLVRWSSRS